MIFIKELFNKIKRPINVKKAFNFKKMVKLAQHPVSNYFKDDILSPSAVPQVIPPEVSISRDIQELIDQYLQKGPSAVGPIIWNEQSNMNYFKQKLMENIGNITDVENILKQYQIKTMQAFPSDINTISNAFTGQLSPTENKLQPGNEIVKLFFEKAMANGSLNKMISMFGMEAVNDGVLNKLGPPVGEFDQRVNFFIKNPEFMPTDIKKDVDSFSEIYNSNDANVPLSANKIINYMVQKGYAPSLFNRLMEAINNDSEFDNIELWVMGGMKGSIQTGSGWDQRAMSYDVNMGDDPDSGALINTIQEGDNNIEKMRFESATLGEMDEASIVVSSFIEKYLGDIFNEMKDLKQVSITNLLNDTAATNNIKLYNIAERMNIYTQGAFEQYDKLLETMGVANKKGSMMIYKNPFGNLKIPLKLIESIFLKPEGDTGSGEYISDVKNNVDGLVEQYKKDILSGKKERWFPKLSSMVQPKLMLNNFLELGELKEYIKLKAKQGNDFNGIKSKIESEGFLAYALSKFSNGNNDQFIDMTLKQDDEYIKSLSYGIEEKKKTGKNEASALINLKYDMTWNSWVLFHHLNSIKDDPSKNDGQGYSTESLRSFIDLFEPHAYVKEMGGHIGGRNNYFDQSKHNYELYNEIRRNEVPKDFKVMQDAFKDIKNLDPNKKMRLFRKYLSFYSSYRGAVSSLKKQESFIKNIKKNKQDTILNYNNKVLEKIRYENDINSKKGLPLTNILDWDNSRLWSFELYKKYGYNAIEKRISTIDGMLRKALETKKVREKSTGKIKDKKKVKLEDISEEFATSVDALNAIKEDSIEEVRKFEKKYNLSSSVTLANSQLFKFIYSSFLQTENRITYLNGMKSKYANLKFSSFNISNIDKLIIDSVTEFEKIFFSIVK